jgi:hypothetical protein
MAIGQLPECLDSPPSLRDLQAACEQLCKPDFVRPDNHGVTQPSLRGQSHPAALSQLCSSLNGNLTGSPLTIPIISTRRPRILCTESCVDAFLA